VFRIRVCAKSVCVCVAGAQQTWKKDKQGGRQGGRQADTDRQRDTGREGGREAGRQAGDRQAAK